MTAHSFDQGKKSEIAENAQKISELFVKENRPLQRFEISMPLHLGAGQYQDYMALLKYYRIIEKADIRGGSRYFRLTQAFRDGEISLEKVLEEIRK